MRDLALSAVSSYTDFDAQSGRLLTLSGVDLIRQRMLIRLRRRRAEWKFDRRKGLLFKTGVSRRFDLAAFSAAVKAEVRSVPGVVRVASVVVTKAGSEVQCVFRCEVRDEAAANENAFVDIAFTATDASYGSMIMLLSP